MVDDVNARVDNIQVGAEKCSVKEPQQEQDIAEDMKKEHDKIQKFLDGEGI